MGRHKKITDPPLQQSSAIINLPQPPLRKAEEFLKAYNSWTYAAVNAIAQEIANIKLHLFRRSIKRGEVTYDEVYEHESLSILHYVNDFMTCFQLFELTQIYLELTGEAYWVIVRSTDGSPQQLWPLRPDWVTVKSSKNFIEAYVYAPGGIRDPGAVVLDPKDVIPFKYPNPLNPYRGKGAVQAAAMAIDTDQFSAEWNRNFFFNSAVPYLILRTQKKVAPAELDRIRSDWESKFQGRTNAHKLALLSGEWADPFVFGDKLKDMDFIEQRRQMRDEILGTFRVGKSAINITEDVNRANAEASNLNFMERVITPKMIRFVAHLNEFYLKNWPEEDLFFDFDDPAPADRELDLKVYENAKNYWMTPNEIRERENLPPLKGGDTIYLPFSVQPIETITGAVQNATDAVKRFFGGKTSDKESGVLIMESDPQKSVRKFMMPIPPRKLHELKKDQIKKKLKKDLKQDLFKLIKNIMTEVDQEGDEKFKNSKGRLNWDQEKRDAHWTKMIAKTDVEEQSMKSMLGNLFDEQEKEVVQNIKNNLKFYAESRRKGKEASFLYNLIDENKKWRSILGPFIKNIVADKGREVLDFLGIPGELDLSQQVAATYLKLDGVAFIKSVNETTRDKLKETLKDGLIKEESIDDLAKRVESVYDQAKGFRSEAIARTEVLRSTNFATLQAFRQSDVVVAKEWLTAQDERVDDLCAGLDGKTVSLDGNFKEGEFTEKHPPLHPNCRCTIIPVLRS